MEKRGVITAETPDIETVKVSTEVGGSQTQLNDPALTTEMAKAAEAAFTPRK